MPAAAHHRLGDVDGVHALDEAGDAARERAFVRAYPFDVEPTDDNRPFFFRYSYWSHLF